MSFTKVLSAVEAEPDRSNQHEFNGVGNLHDLLGESRREIPAVFRAQSHDQEYETTVTWYDARAAHETRSEYRLYFRTNPVMTEAREGDRMRFSLLANGALLCELLQ